MRTKLCWLLALLLSMACKDEGTPITSDKENESRASLPSTKQVEFSPIEVEIKAFPIEDMAVPFTTKASSPKKVTAYTNIQKIAQASPKIILPDTSFSYQFKKIEIQIEKTSALYPTPVKAKEADFKDKAIHNIRFWEAKHGLNTSFIHAIYQDSKGYMWFGGVSDGICRFDGHSFVTYTKDQGLSREAINSIWEEEQGDFWLGTRSGLVKFDGHHFFSYKGMDEEIFNITKGHEGHLLFASSEGVFLLQEDTFHKLEFRNNINSFYTLAIVEDKAGNIWLGGAYGLCMLTEDRSMCWTSNSELRSYGVQDLVVAEDGTLWIATFNGLWHYDGQQFTQIQALAGKQINKLIQARNGDIWLGTFENGVYQYDGTFLYNYSEREGLSNEEVVSIFEDDKGQIWAGTHSAGVNQINPNSFVNLTKNEGLSSNKINHFIKDHKGAIWMATEYDGLIKYDGTHYYHYSKETTGLPINNIQFILEDKAKNLWLGSFWYGLIKFDGKNFTHFTPQQGLNGDYIWSISEDDQANIWISTEDGGLCSFDGQTFTHYYKEDGSSISSRSKMTSNGVLWLTNFEDVFRYDGINFYRVHTTDGKSLTQIDQFFEDKNQRIWMTTVNGVYVLDGKTLTHYSPNSGISDNEVWSINQDNDNNIWIGTEKGIDLMETKGDSLPISPIFKSFKEIDGLKTQDNIANSSFLNKNQLWWGMGKNLLQLDLDKFYSSIDTTPPNIFLNSIKLNDQFFDFSKLNQTKLSEENIEYESSNKFQNYPNELVVDYKTNHFTFDFAALEWSAPHDVQYRYLLEGLEKEWSAPKKENKIDYRGLTHGKYTFNVQAKGKWSDWGAPLSYSFKIRPPWWFTWWAYVIYGLLFSALVYGIFQFLRRRLHLRNQLELEQKEAQRLKELDSFKSRLYTNLTHEFRTPLTVILGMTQQIRNEPKQFLDTGTQLIERNGKNLLRLINQLLDLSKLEDKSFQLNLQQSDIVAYLRYLTESFQTYTNSENLSLQFLATLEQLQMDYDPEQLQQIMTNLISNAVKYTPSGGAIKVKLKRIEQQLQLEIHDTGIGIAAADLSHIFDRFYQVDDSATRKEEGTGIGLAHTRELVQLMGGEFM